MCQHALFEVYFHAHQVIWQVRVDQVLIQVVSHHSFFDINWVKCALLKQETEAVLF